MSWFIRKKDDHKKFMGTRGWTDIEHCNVYGPTSHNTMALPEDGEWVTPAQAYRKRPQGRPAKDPTTGFYEAVEKFIGAHTGSDRPSKELENLCSKLRDADPLYVNTLAKKKHVNDMFDFAYRLLKLQMGE